VEGGRKARSDWRLVEIMSILFQSMSKQHNAFKNTQAVRPGSWSYNQYPHGPELKLVPKNSTLLGTYLLIYFFSVYFLSPASSFSISSTQTQAIFRR